MKYRIDKNELLNNFVTYAKINTRSNEWVPKDQIPSTSGQMELAQLLKQQLENLHLKDIKLNTQNGFLTALLPGNTKNSKPTIGFIAHLDTANYESSKVLPQIHPNYDGNIINFKNGLSLDPNVFPNLKNYLGQTLITSDGTTLLGVDDKAGIAGLISAIVFLLKHPEIKHQPLKLAFGPDEEIGRGADNFDVKDFAADFAYTLDNGLVGEMEYETFNAAQAIIEIEGKSVHPGQAKGNLVNAISIGEKIDSLIPRQERAEMVSGDEGFYLLLEFNGKIEHAQLIYIIRDFNQDNFINRKQKIFDVVTEINKELDYPRINLKMKDQYYNMGNIIKKDPYPLDLAQRALRNLGIKPKIIPFRGGTDGSKITYLGLPTPNLFNGGENFHGPYEFVTVEAMAKLSETIIEIVHLAQSNH
ncbi:MAG: peptidase T [Lactobacillaceae bacterium]